MELTDYLQRSAEHVHAMLDIAAQDLTDEVAHWRQGTANSIAALLAHMVTAEDFLINRHILGNEPVLEAGGWASKTGIPANRREIWNPDFRLNLDAFGGYRLAVQASAKAYFDSVTAADLDREVSWVWGEPQAAARWLQIVFFSHILGHCGEISAIKGIRGLKGLPF